MEVSANYSGEYFTGTGLTLTCTVILEPNVDSNEDVIMTWSGPRDIPGERYRVFMANELDDTRSTKLVISPLAEEDDNGQYTCSVTIIGGSDVLGSTNRNDVNISALGNNYSVCT